eukprot:gnl/TRDRNA2_/TRDRNA2_163584_c2_seq2.p2 gnl/TRDRNA2_/TRDRNA2_163584_c2~~gnl/TRDRNA2_/TRDRNA2_163584_c2_seq2.p2  ORF type:complete len:106 (-),score=13.33 gnl/TRDRNA2_/TRDRNA2_163584_c2_seq2:10-327(-)
MRRFSDVVDGRCMEQLELGKDYKDKTRGGNTWDSWWLYSKNLIAEKAGRYYILSWLTDRESGSIVTGKYEMTLGPWIWYGYADDASVLIRFAVHCVCGMLVNNEG